MRRIAYVLLVTGLGSPSLADAQEPLRFGLGVSLDMTPIDGGGIGSGSTLEARTGNLHFPLQVSRRIRLEPMIGYATESDKVVSTSSGLTSTSVSKFTIWRAGLGAFYVMRAGSAVRLYVGPRIGWRRRARRDKISSPGSSISQDVRERDWFFSGAFGGEYYLARSFSIGGEAQMIYTGFGSQDVTLTPPPPPGSGSSVFSGHSFETAGLIVIRWFVR